MKKDDLYKVRDLFHKIEMDYSNDMNSSRAELIHQATKEGVKLCNDYLMKMKPQKPKRTNRII